MICQECGTRNPTGSKFCNHCGSGLLPDSRQICPNCQTPNPDHLLYCDNCGTRLAEEPLPKEEKEDTDAPSSAPNRSEPFSLPSRPPGQTANLEVSGEIPDWLKTGEETDEVVEDGPAERSPTDAGGKTELPDWAREAQASGEAWEDKEAPTLDEVSGDHSPADDLPVWLMDEDTAETIFTKDKSTDELFEVSESQATEEVETADAAEELPEWLQGLATGTGPLPSLDEAEWEPEARGTAGETATEKEGAEQEAEIPYESEQAQKASESLRSWLADIEVDEGEAESVEPATDTDLPDWLTEIEGETPAGGSEPAPEAPQEGADAGEFGLVEPEQEQLSDWMQDLDAEEIEPATPPGGEEIPDWLADMEAHDEDTETVDEGEVEIPDWLAGTELVQSAGAQREEPAADEEVPDWLAGLGAEVEPAGTEELPAEAPEPAADEEVPDWPAEVDAGMVGQPAGEEAAASQTDTSDLLGGPEPEDDQETEDAEEVPDWLANLDMEEVPALPDLPEGAEVEAQDREEEDWLADLDMDEAPTLPDLPGGAEVEVQDTEEEDWLATLGSEETVADGDEADAGEVEEVTLDWLADLEAEAAAAPELADEDQEDAEPGATEEEEAETVPDWLAGIDTDSTTAQSLPEAEAEGSDVPGWLAEETEGAAGDAGEPAFPAGDEDEIPAWLTGLDEVEDEEKAPSERGEAEAEEAFPDWLMESDADLEPAEAEVAGEEGFPDWLAAADTVEDADIVTPEAEEGEPAEAEVAGEEEFLDWLEETDTLENADIVTPEAEDQEEFPDWLMEEDAAPSPPEEVSAPTQMEGPGEVEDTPDWLAGMEVEEVESPAEIEGEGDTDWLSELGEIDTTTPETPDSELPQTSELPDWVQDMAPPQTGPLVPPDETAPVSDEIDDFLGDLEDEEELPDWLMGADTPAEGAPDEAGAEAGAKAGTEADELPDWLSGEEAEADEFSDWLSESEEVEAAADEPFDEETIPAGPVEAEQAETPSASAEIGAEAEEAASYVPADDLPEWLSDVMLDMDDADDFLFDEEEEEEAPSPPAALESVPDEMAAGEVPEWLEGEEADTVDPDLALPDTAAEPTPLDELPEWLRPPGGLEGVSLEEDDRWGHLLDELPPPQEAGQELSAADIPEWLQALKPRELTEQAGEPVEEKEEAAVEAGPLAGLRGVVEIEPVIAEIHTAERSGEYTVSKEQQQQAALLRQLIRTAPQEAIAVGAPQERASSLLPRVLLTLLLLAVILAGFFYPGLVDTPRAAALADTQALIAEAAPRPVLVAFEYTPAMAGALDAPASALLEQVAASGSPVLFASQSAAGLALAEQNVAAVAGLDGQRVGYIPGGAVGLRRLASCLQTDADCQTVYGRPLDEEVSTALSESGLILVLAGDRESAINWIEQIAAPAAVPMVAVVPQAIAPVIAPYAASGQLAALLNETSLAGDGDQSAAAAFAAGGEAQGTALALGQWLVAALLLLGNLFYLARGSLRSRRRDRT